MERGTYVEHDGRPAVRFVRSYPHPVERVWTALTDPEELGHWFPSSVRMEQRAGGTVTFDGDPHAAPSTGTVLVFDPPRRLAYTWGGDELRFELTPLVAGCRLTFTTLLEGPDTAARNAAGWEVCLEALDSALGGGTPTTPAGPTPAWRRHFDAYVAAGVPSGAPVPE